MSEFFPDKETYFITMQELFQTKKPFVREFLNLYARIFPDKVTYSKTLLDKETYVMSSVK
jgi:hypothetical protein